MLLLKGIASVAPWMFAASGSADPKLFFLMRRWKSSSRILKCWPGYWPLVHLPSDPLLVFLLFCSVSWGSGPSRLLGGLC